MNCRLRQIKQQRWKILTAELAEDDPSFTYRQLGERLARIKEKKDAADKAAEERLRALQGIADEAAKTKEEPSRLNLTQPGEYGLFTVLREFSANKDEAYLSSCARQLVAHLRGDKLLMAGWSNSKGGRCGSNSLYSRSLGIPHMQIWGSIQTLRNRYF
jgi:type I restriction enzyme, R subunit